MRTHTLLRRLGWTLAALLLAMTIYDDYGPAGARDLAPPASGCEAAGAGAGYGYLAGTAMRGQIRYDSGRTLRYCSLAAMFAQLGAQEQPGMVRSVLVLTVDGRWVDAVRARYLRAAPAWLAYDGSMTPAGARLQSYPQLLAACARAGCV